MEESRRICACGPRLCFYKPLSCYSHNQGCGNPNPFSHFQPCGSSETPVLPAGFFEASAHISQELELDKAQ